MARLAHHVLAVAVVWFAGCTDDSSSPSGPGVTTHVLTIEFAASMSGACIEGSLADVDASTPGPQYECSVSQVVTASQTETVLPMCNNFNSPSSSTNRPCWAVELDAANCTLGEHLKLAIERAEQPPDAVVKAQCLAPGM
jgi:hypothetical protein